MEVNFFLKYATELLSALTGFFAAGGGLFALGKKKIDSVKTQLKTDIVSEMDSKQNESIKRQEDTLTEVLAAIFSLDSKIENLAGEVTELKTGYQKLNNFMETQQERETFKAFKRRLGKRIEDLIYAYIAEMKFNSAFESLLIKGGEEAKTFFGSLVEDGFKEMNIMNAKKRSKAILRALRSQNSGNTLLTPLCIEKIKLQAAVPALDTLWAKLVIIKTSQVQIDYYEEYERAVMAFLEDFVAKSAKIYKEEMK